MTPTDRIEIYRTRSPLPGRSGWRWRYRAANGHVLAHGGQAYSRKIDMLAALATVTGLTITPPGRYSRQGGATGPAGRYVEVVWLGKAVDR